MKNEFSPKLPERREEFNKLPASPFAPTFIEKLLMALISANDVPPEVFGIRSRDNLASVRLSNAMHAIFGTPLESEPINDLPTLVSAAQRHLGDETQRQLEIRDRSPELESEIDSVGASIALSEVLGLQGATMSGHPKYKDYQRLRSKYLQKDTFDYLFWVTNVTEHAEEKSMMRDLELIEDILARWNQKISRDPDKLGMHSLSQKWPGE